MLYSVVVPCFTKKFDYLKRIFIFDAMYLPYEVKKCPLKLKDLDTKQGIVTGYLSVFGNKDSDGDIMVKGAYARSLSQRGPQGTDEIYHALQHDHKQLPGKFKVLKEDNHGLYFESKLSKSTLGRDTLIMYEEGIYREHSVGFMTLQDDINKGTYDEKVGNRIYEVKFIEGSTVTSGANSLAKITGIKSDSQIQNYFSRLNDEQLVKALEINTKSLSIGRLSDSSLQALEKTATHILQECQKRFDPPQSTQDVTKATELFFSELSKRIDKSCQN